jgi:hypothetical protein
MFSSDLELVSFFLYTRTSKCRFYDFSLIIWGPKLGEGQFGTVLRAVLLDNNARWEVAIKKAKEILPPEKNDISFEKVQEDLVNNHFTELNTYM